MAVIPIEEAKEGMVIIKDVVDRGGNLLVKAGIELTDKWIRRLEARGVAEIFIEGGDDMSDEEEMQVRENIKERLQETFSEVQDNEIMMAIALYAEKYLMSKF